MNAFWDKRALAVEAEMRNVECFHFPPGELGGELSAIMVGRTVEAVLYDPDRDVVSISLSIFEDEPAEDLCGVAFALRPNEWTEDAA